MSAPPVKKNYTVLRAGAKNEFEVIIPPADLTVRAICDQIPQHYFKRSLWKGLYYIFRDIAQVAATAAAMYFLGYRAIDAADATGVAAIGWAARVVLWSMFWFVQGTNLTGLWVMAHECGHQALSESRTINDAVGIVLHSFLLVPYHSWRISHGNHHKHTNHITKDTAFVPVSENHVIEAILEAPIVSLFKMFVMLTAGWPAYLIANASGQDYGRRTNHYEPSSPLFRVTDHNDVVASDFGIVAMLAAIVAASFTFGSANVFCWYFVPYLGANAWLVLITFLQHTDVRLAHYAPEDWTFVRGALAAIDRNYGAPLNWMLHHINDSHVIHHLVSQMPFYHAIEVTRHHCKDIFGPLYQTSNKTLWASLWESWVECRYVIPSDGVAVFHK